MSYWEPLDWPYATKKDAQKALLKFMKSGKGYKKASFKISYDAMKGYWIIYFKETRKFGLV